MQHENAPNHGQAGHLLLDCNDMANQLLDLRHELHSMPELSGSEVQTAVRIVRFFQRLAPDQMITGLGGNGLAFVFEGASPGPTVLLRSDMDAVPVQEAIGSPYRSTVDQVSHACGHDGHMAILAGVGMRLSVQRPSRGRVICLFQPAEETGSGARAVIADHRFAALAPDVAFALHNLPGEAIGRVIVREGPCCCASRGMHVTLSGISAHAAQPETGISPAMAVCRIIEAFGTLPSTLTPHELSMATVVGARLGEMSFGTTPAHAEVFVTLRAETDASMERLQRFAEGVIAQISAFDRLAHHIVYQDEFPSTVNTPRATRIVRQAAVGLETYEPVVPFRWSEDFGHFTRRFGGALVGLGAGIAAPPLHSPEYDFPDDLVPVGVDLLGRVLEYALQ